MIRQKAFTPSGKLPPVLPVVLYNGEKRWKAAQNVADLVELVPGGLERYRPDLAYLLLDEGAIVSDPAWSDQMRNVAAALFRLEHNRDEQDMLKVLGTLVEWLKAPEQTGLRRSFVVWIRRVLLPNRAPEMELPEFTDLQDLHEVHDMLAERIKKWPEQWEARGEVKGEAKFLKMQIASKYGECPDWAQSKLNAADSEQLEAWGKRIFRAETLEELLSD
ncbi:Rpn family recombination-promoting nuclease/putative transposase [Vreelandella alkaliphila]|uniref:Rpn family recombination-promoting nuclease/putative transposase n=1 Tax=Vreelandella alkaliphila TaxID=272774 RepID=UPI003FD78E4D